MESSINSTLQSTPILDPSHELPPVQYAAFLSRFGAYIIDGLALGAVIGFPLIAFPKTVQPLMILVGVIIYWLYYAYQESSESQATIGKKVFGLIVVDMNGKRVSFGRASSRFFGRLLSQAIFDIGYLIALFTSKKQTLHDIIAGTLVIKK